MRRGFSLMELLVVISIIAILASLLMPAVAMVRDAAKSAKCQSNLRQLAMGSEAYSTDQDGYLVPCRNTWTAESWADLCDPYLERNQALGSKAKVIHTCPSTLKTITQWPLTYGAHAGWHRFWSDTQPIRHQGEIERASETLQFCDVAQASAAGTCAGWLDSSDATWFNDSTQFNKAVDAMGFWQTQLTTHPDVGAYILRFRHGRGQTFNVVWMDGHVSNVGHGQLLYRNMRW